MKTTKNVLRIVIIYMSVIMTPLSTVYSNENNFITQEKDIPTYIEISEGIYGGIIPRLELLSGVLSHTKWINRRGPASQGNEYYRDLHEFLEPYKNHAAVKLAEKLTKRGFTYDAPPNFMLSLSPLPELYPTIGYSDYLIQRARNKRILDDFRIALAALSAESNFIEFYNNHQTDYQAWIDHTFEDFSGDKLSNWLQDFFGWNGEQFHIILAPAMFPQGGYGATYQIKDELIAVQVTREHGISEHEPDFGGGSILQDLTLHELGHSYVNPTVEANIDYLEMNDFAAFYEPVKDIMQQQAYGHYITFFNESILRAVTAIAYSELNNELDNIQKYNEYEKNRGFYLQDLLTEELLSYVGNRDTYTDFRIYLPTLFEKMNKDKNTIIENFQKDR